MSEEKAKAREFWLVRDIKTNTWIVSEHKIKWADVKLGNERHHVVEYSALEAAEKKIKELEAKLWVAKDNSLRTYDGLADKADKYDEANEMLEKMAAALLLYKDICTWKDESGDEFIAAKALKEYEDWKKR